MKFYNSLCTWFLLICEYSKRKTVLLLGLPNVFPAIFFGINNTLLPCLSARTSEYHMIFAENQPALTSVDSVIALQHS